MNKQRTLKGSFSLFGKGLHTGLNLTVTFNPAPENTGIKIQRIDLDGHPIIDAIAERVTDTQRGTVLCDNEVRVSTVEHGLAALYALGIDNCLIQVNGPEVPILDGSAEIYVENIRHVGVVEQNAPKDYYVVHKKIEVRDDEKGSCITILPDEQFSITAMIAFQSKVLSSQFATLDDMANFEQEIAPARTFCFVREVEMMLEAGLITRTKRHRRKSTSSPSASVPPTTTPRSWASCRPSRCNGRTSLRATNSSISSAIWRSSASPSRAASAPRAPDTPSTTSSRA